MRDIDGDERLMEPSIIEKQVWEEIAVQRRRLHSIPLALIPRVDTSEKVENDIS